MPLESLVGCSRSAPTSTEQGEGAGATKTHKKGIPALQKSHPRCFSLNTRLPVETANRLLLFKPPSVPSLQTHTPRKTGAPIFLSCPGHCLGLTTSTSLNCISPGSTSASSFVCNFDGWNLVLAGLIIHFLRKVQVRLVNLLTG